MYFWISFHLDWQIDKDIFNWPIMAHTQILVEDTVFATSGELINETTMLEQSDWWGESMLSHLGLDQTKLNKLTYFQGENKFGSPPVSFHWFLLSSQSWSLYRASIASQTNMVSALKIESILIHVPSLFSSALSALSLPPFAWPVDYQMWHNLINLNNDFVSNVTGCEFLSLF